MTASMQLKQLLRRSVIPSYGRFLQQEILADEPQNESLVELALGISAVLAPGDVVSRIAPGILVCVIVVLDNCRNNKDFLPAFQSWVFSLVVAQCSHRGHA